MTDAATLRGLVPLLALGLMLGCTALPSSTPSAPAGNDQQIQAAAAGSLLVRIKWPALDLPGFQAQLIPLRTRSIRLSASNPQGKGGELVIVRELGTSEATASFRLLAGSDYTVKAEAFAEATPTTDSNPLAVGNAINVTIWKSTTTQVPLTLTALFAPGLTRMDPTYGEVGKIVSVSGYGFGLTQKLAWKLTLGGVALTANATRSSDTQLSFKVPNLPNRTIGNVVVTVDGVPSTTVALFTVGPVGLEATLGWAPTPGTGMQVTVPGGAPTLGSGLGLGLDGTATDAGGLGLGLGASASDAGGLGLGLDGAAGTAAGIGLTLDHDSTTGSSLGMLVGMAPGTPNGVALSLGGDAPAGTGVQLGLDATSSSGHQLDITLEPSPEPSNSGFSLTID